MGRFFQIEHWFARGQAGKTRPALYFIIWLNSEVGLSTAYVTKHQATLAIVTLHHHPACPIAGGRSDKATIKDNSYVASECRKPAGIRRFLGNIFDGIGGAARHERITRDGGMPNRAANDELKELALAQPTARQISVMELPVVRNSAMARSARRRESQPRGVSPKTI
jgi:hypothetical protein